MGMPGGGPHQFITSQLKQLRGIEKRATKAGFSDIARAINDSIESAEALAEIMEGEEEEYSDEGPGIEPDSEVMEEVEQDMKNTVAALKLASSVQGSTKKATIQRKSLISSALKILNRLLSMMNEGKEMMDIGKKMEQEMMSLSKERMNKDKERMLSESTKMRERFTKEETQRAEFDKQREKIEEEMRGKMMQGGMRGYGGPGMGGSGGGRFGGMRGDQGNMGGHGMPPGMNQEYINRMMEGGTKPPMDSGSGMQQPPPPPSPSEPLPPPPPPTSGSLFDVFVSWLYNGR